jgi:uncharacterized repeat protein (TIGR03803 family)
MKTSLRLFYWFILMHFANFSPAQEITARDLAGKKSSTDESMDTRLKENLKTTYYSKGVYYGVSPKGGDFDGGVIFIYNPENQDVTNVHSFKNSMDEEQENGILPVGRFLKTSDGKLYGVTTDGGDPYGAHNVGYGIIYRFDTSGNIFTKLYDFKLETGALPYSPLMQASNGKIYGTYTSGGPGNAAGIYSFDLTTGIYKAEYSFTIFDGSPRGILTEAAPGKLFGTLLPERYTNDGRAFVFDINTGKAAFIHIFQGDNPKTPEEFVDGGDGKLYAVSGDELISINTTDFLYRTEYKFDSESLGLQPFEPITAGSNGKIYGTTRFGGERGFGTIFSFDPSSKILDALYSGYSMEEFYHGSRLVENNNKEMYGMMGREFSNVNGAIFYFMMDEPFTYDIRTALPGGNYAGPGGSITWFPPTECIKPDPTATNSGPVCAGAELKLFAAHADSYIWRGPGNFTSSLRNPVIENVSTDRAGVYEVFMFNGTTCFAMARTTVIVNPTPVVKISADGPLTICKNEDVTLSAAGQGSWLWSDLSTDSAITVTSTGQYYTALTDQQGCTGFSDTVDVIVHDLPAKPVITWNGSQLTVPAAYQQYLWYFNNVMLTADTSNKLTPLQPGSYSIHVSDGNGCVANSDYYLLQPKSSGVKVGSTLIYSYPNPAKDRLSFYRKTDFQKKIRVRIVDQRGEVFLEEWLSGSSSYITISGIPAGLYIASLDDGVSRASFQFIKIQ